MTSHPTLRLLMPLVASPSTPRPCRQLHQFRIAFSVASLWIASATGLYGKDEVNTEFFEREVRPILVNHCYACHSAKTKPAGGLRVDDLQGLVKGGNSGPAVIPGSADKGTLLRRVAPNAQKRMPAEGEPLTDEQISVLSKWIADGAYWPTETIEIIEDTEEYRELRETHWAWQPLTSPVLPGVSDPHWPLNDVDRFLMARWNAAGITPAPEADRAKLLRRLTFDLTGLPPTPEELEAFLADESPVAYEQAVDRLLGSPAFALHWARHWLDIARYGESTGPSRNIPYPHAWKYRDWVIDSIHDDLPYDEFIRQQIAGDLLPSESDEQANKHQIATGFLALGVKDVNQRFEVRFVMDNIDEQIDVISKAFLGITVSCARCHDHKFDPITQSEYYGLAGILASTEMLAGVRNQMGGSGLAYYVPKKLAILKGQLPAADPAEVARLTEEVRVAKQEWDSVRGTPEGLRPGPNGIPFQRTLRQKYEKLQAELLSLTDPAELGFAAHGVRDAETIGDIPLRIRGEAEALGPMIPRGLPKIVDNPAIAPFDSTSSGRRQLAEWLVHETNPLTPRVFVNRVWAHLFGRGLVSTVDNFGVTGALPSHPELLDYLARTTQQDGWSLKRLVRRLVLSRAYRLSGDRSIAAESIDPENRLFWRHIPRRLTAEEIRDSVLLAAGELDQSRPNESPAKELPMVEIRDNGSEARMLHEYALRSNTRSVYLPQLRGIVPRSLEAFDPVDPTLVSGSRSVTTVPSQALFLLNSSFVRNQSLKMADRFLAREMMATDRLAAIYQTLLGRAPTDIECQRAVAFLEEFAATYQPTDDTQPTSGDATEADNERVEPENPDEVDQTGVEIREPVVSARDATVAAWSALIQAIISSAEFRYVR